MALSNTLNTNEIKNAAGTEVEFELQRPGPGPVKVWKQILEPPSKPYRLTVSHQEVGAGLKRRRRSVVRFDKTVASEVDSTVLVTCSAYVVTDFPVGAMNTTTEMANVIANVLSFCATTGAATTVLFDCTGNGAQVLLNGAS